MADWDDDIPFEIETSTSWASELLAVTDARDDGGSKKRKNRGDTDNGVGDEAEGKWAMTREEVIPDKDVFLLSPCFLPEESRNIIAAAEALGFGRTNYPKLYRGNCRLITTDPSLAEVLWSRMQAQVPLQVEEEGRVWDAVGLNECFRLSKYIDGDVFGQHVDTCYQRSCSEKSMYTVNIYLNGPDEFQKGATRFFNDDRLSPECSVTPAAGLGLVFRQPPSAHYSHDGERVCGGTKYLLRSDVMYRSRE